MRCSPWQLVHTRLFRSCCFADLSRKRSTTARGSTSWPSWHRAHEASMDSTGNMRSGGMMFASSLRCATDGPWQDAQLTAFEACVDGQVFLAEVRMADQAGAVVGDLLRVSPLRRGLARNRAAGARRIVELQRRWLRGRLSARGCGLVACRWIAADLLRPAGGRTQRDEDASRRPRRHRTSGGALREGKCISVSPARPSVSISERRTAHAARGIRRIPSRAASGSPAASRPRRGPWRP